MTNTTLQKLRDEKSTAKKGNSTIKNILIIIGAIFVGYKFIQGMNRAMVPDADWIYYTIDVTSINPVTVESSSEGCVNESLANTRSLPSDCVNLHGKIGKDSYGSGDLVIGASTVFGNIILPTYISDNTTDVGQYIIEQITNVTLDGKGNAIITTDTGSHTWGDPSQDIIQKLLKQFKLQYG